MFEVINTGSNGKKIYACSFCQWICVGRDKMVKHEMSCVANPLAMGCGSCANRRAEDDKQFCTGGILKNELFKNRNLVKGCVRWVRDKTKHKKLKAGDKFSPKNFYRDYTIIKEIDITKLRDETEG